jgi:hypothetical protein
MSTEKAKPISGGGRPTVYKTKDGKRVPGVTTVTGRFKDAGGLIRWAYNCGRDGIDMDRKRDDAADAGSIGHQWVEDTIHGRELSEFPAATPDMLEKARSALDAFLDWRMRNAVEFAHTELPLISEAHAFGGTIDAVLVISGKLRLGDWKTGNRIYPEHLAQIGGYSLLLREHGHEITGADIVRLDKEHGGFAHHEYPMSIVELGEQAFLRMRELYDLDAKLKKVAA